MENIIYRPIHDEYCKEFLEMFVKCEKESIITTESICNEEKKLYLKCREENKEKLKENSYKVMTLTKNLYFNGNGGVYLISNKKK